MIGRMIDRYRVERKLGQGGMGSVWEATDTRLKRPVALKLLPESLASDSEVRRRFLREARAASVLNHPGIAGVYDAGEAEGSVYIAFQKIDGETLTARIARGPLPLREAVDIARQCAEALAHAHSRGILHRDVTSNNIMITPAGKAVLIDFGLARPDHGATLTRQDTLTGTPAYLAPEIWRGENADARCDVYGLGIVMYEMVTRHRPFIAERPEALMFSVLNDEPRSLTASRPDTPRDLERLILKAMAREPEDRYPGAADLVRALEEFEMIEFPPAPETSRSPVTPHAARQSPRPMNIRSFPRVLTRSGRRGREIAWERMLLLVLTVLAAGYGMWRAGSRYHPNAPVFSSVAVLPFRNLSPEAEESQYLSDGLGQMLVTKLAELNGIRVIPWETSVRFQEDEIDLAETARRLRVEALLTGTFQRYGGFIQGTISLTDARKNTVLWAGEFQEAGDNLFAAQRDIAAQAALALKGKLTGPEKRKLAEPPSHDSKAWDTYLRGAAELLAGDRDGTDRAFQLFREALDGDSTLAEAWVGLGAVYAPREFYGWNRTFGLLDEAEGYFEKALDLKPDMAAARRGLAAIYWYQGRSEDCLRLALQTSRNRQLTVDDIIAMSDAYMRGGLIDQAIVGFQQVLERDPESIVAHYFLIPCYAWTGRFSDCVRAADEYVEKFGADAEPFFWLGVSHLYLGNPEKARHNFEACYEVLPEREGVFLGYATRLSGDEKTARSLWQKTLDRSKRSVASGPDDFRRRVRVIAIYALLGDSLRSVQEQDSLLQSIPSPGWTIVGDLSWYLCLAGQYERALYLEKTVVSRGSNDYIPMKSLLAPLIPPEYAWLLDEVRTAAADQYHRLEAQYAPMAPP